MATSLKIGIDAKDAERGIDKLNRKIDSIGDAANDANKDAGQALDKISDKLDRSEQEANQAGQAVEAIADPAAINSLSDLAKKIDTAAKAAGSLESEAKQAATVTKSLGGDVKSTGEVTSRASDIVFDLVKNLGSGGLLGALESVVPKFAGFASTLSGPWGAAAAFGVGMLVSLASEMNNSAQASEEAKNAVESLKRATDEYLKTLTERVRGERDLRRELDAGTDATIDRLQDEIDVRATVAKELQSEMERLRERQRIIKENTEGFDAAKVAARMANNTAEIVKAEISLNKTLKEQAQLRSNLDRAMQSRRRRQDGEKMDQDRDNVARAAQSQEKSREAIKELVSSLGNDHVSNIQGTLKEQQLAVQAELAERRKILQEASRLEAITQKEFTRLWGEVTEQSTRKLEAVFKADREAREKQSGQPANSPQNNVPVAPAKSQGRSPAINSDAVAVGVAPDQLDAIRSKLGTDIRPSHRDQIEALNQAAKDLAGHRTQGHEAELRRQLQERQRARLDDLNEQRKLDPTWGQDPMSMQREAQKEQTRREQEERQLQARLRRDQQKEVQRARHQIQTGDVSGDELIQATQEGMNNALNAAQASGKLSEEAVKSIQTMANGLASTQESAQQLAIELQRVTAIVQGNNQTFNQRRRAQMGGGRP